jgi:endoglycosylceramidase
MSLCFIVLLLACVFSGQSWSYWQYKFYDDPTTAGNDDEGLFFAGNGTLQEVKIRSLVRSYVRRVQGTLQSSRFDADSGSFSLSFQANTLIAAPTEIFLSPFFYPGGARVSINPPGAATYYAHNSLLFVTSLQNGTISVSVV